MIKLKTWLKILFVFSKRIFRFSIDFLLILFFIMNNFFKYGKLYDKNILFVTAAEKNYFSQLITLLKSFKRHLSDKIIVYDLGLEKEQKEYLSRYFNGVEIRKFNFQDNPKFFGEYIDNKLGNYAWKPVIVDELINQYKNKVVWLDAGNIITYKIVFLKISLTALGLVVPVSSNRIVDWTHPKTIEYIGIQNKYLKSNNYASGLIGFDYNLSIAKQISAKWSEFSQIQECISPTGSSRDNHRQDQAVLTLLLYKYLFKSKLRKFFYPQTNFIYGVLFHRRKIYNF